MGGFPYWKHHEAKKALFFRKEGCEINSGSVLLSHAATHAVPSALKSLTTVFEMGTGVTSSPSPPETQDLAIYKIKYGKRAR
jgi:hypothetical protein